MIQKLGKYAVVEKLGEGAMGAVYKAYDEILDRYVAIKTMAEDIKWDPELKLRFYREARSAASLHHPNIVTIHDLGEEGKITYIIMELLEGKDLKDIIKERVPLSIEKKLLIIAQVCEGLQHAHSAGIIHRDVKPGNIHFAATGNVKIVDFGIARIPSSDLTRSGVRLGTPIYMSPEQIRGEQYDERSDMFSTAIVFYELLTYVHPFRDKNIAKTLDNILFQNHYPFAEQCPEAPPGLWPIINTAMAKEAAKRYPSMAEFGRACRNLLVDMNVASQRMANEVNNALPQLRQAVSRPGAPPRLLAILQQAQSLLGQDEKPDHVSLKRILAGLSEESHFLQTVPQSGARAPETAPFEPAAGPAKPAPPQAPPGPTPEEVRGRELLLSGQQLLREERLDDAQASLRQALDLAGRKDEIVQALAEVDRRIAERRRAHSASLLDRARLSAASRKYTEAIEALNEVLQVDPGNQEAAELRRKAVSEAEAERARQARRLEGEREKTAGLKLLAEQKYRDSIAALKRAAGLLGDDAVIQKALRDAEEAVRVDELRRQVQSELSEAAQLLRAEALDKARARAQHVIEISPGNPDAADLLARIDQAQEQKRKAAEISSLLDQSRDNLNRKDFEAAYARARKVLEIDPADENAGGLIQSIDQAREAKLRQDQVDAALLQSGASLERQDFAEAARQAEAALTLDPDNASARAMLRNISQAEAQKKRNDELAHLVKEGQRAFLRDDLGEAEKYTLQALEIDPQHGKAKDLMRRIAEAGQKRRREEIAALIARGRQAVERGELQEAGGIGQQALQLDQESDEARSFVASVAQAQEARRQEEIAGTLARGRQALERGDFEEAGREAAAVQGLDPQNSGGALLLKDIKRERKNREKEQAKEAKRLEKESKRQGKERHAAAAARAADAESAQDRTVLLEKPKARGVPKIALWIGIPALVIILGAVVFWQLPRTPHAPDYSGQLAAAQASMDRGLFDEAMAAAQQVLAASPGNPQAESIVAAAQKKKAEKETGTLLMEAQSLRAEGKMQESLDTLARLLAIDPANEAALAVRSQIETEMAASKSGAEQDATIKQWLASAESLLAAGKLAEAKAGLDRVARIRPDSPELKVLRRKLTVQTYEAGRQEKEKTDLAQKQSRIEDLSRQAETLFKQGKYTEALAVVDQWIAAVPQNTRAQSLQHQSAQAQQSLRSYEASMSQKLYDEALKAVSLLEKANPADPTIADLRKRAEGRKAAAKATISVYRLGPPCKLTLDDEQLGTEGEVEGKSIGVGRHKVTIENASGKQFSRTMEFVDGQTAVMVYDTATMELRGMTEADRLLLSQRKIREEIHQYPVEHRHTFGRCTGTLLISGMNVQYQASDKGHAFNRAFSSLKLRVNSDKLEMNSSDGRQNWTFKVRDAAQAKEIMELWDRLQRLAK